MSRSRLALAFILAFLIIVTTLVGLRQAALTVAAALDSALSPPTLVVARTEERSATTERAPLPAPHQASQPEPTPPAPTERSVTVIVDVLNVRQGPGFDYEIIDQVQMGDELAVLETTDGWLRVRIPDGSLGYVNGLYVAGGDVAPRTQAAPDTRGVTPPGAWGPSTGRWGRRSQSAPWGAPPSANVAPSAPWSESETTDRATDDAGNSVRVNNQTGGAYTFDSDAFLRLLRDEGIEGLNVAVTLADSPGGNRSGTTFNSMLIDCNPITVPIEGNRTAPPGNGRTGADFCNAVGLHEVYHLIQLARGGYGGTEPQADRFANERLDQYTLVQAR